VPQRGIQDFGATDYGTKYQVYGQSRGTPPPQKRYASNIHQQMSTSAYQPRTDVRYFLIASL
jgi:hypothetical protein